ncbi:MAG: hypothetical protein ACK55Z_23085, partial [bacterium]
ASEASFEGKTRNGIKGNHNLSLANAVKLLPTPTSRDWKGPGTRQLTLPMALLPTPTGMNNRETGQCRNWGADLTHSLKCDCRDRRTHWI